MNFASDLIAEMPGLKRYAGFLTRNGNDADDLLQDTLLRAWAARDGFDGANLGGWLHNIMRNRHRDIRSLAENRLTARRADITVVSDRHRTAPPGQDASLQFRDFVRAYDRLRPAFRSAIYLIGVAGHSFAGAAAEADVPMGTLQVRVARARAELREACA